MSEADHIFPGGAFDGEDDSLATMGTITVSPYSLKFETEGLTLDFPTQGLEMDLGGDEGDRVIFSHPNFPGWKIYSLDAAILEHRSLQRVDLRERLAELKYQHSGPSKHVKAVYMALGGLILLILGLWAFNGLILGLIVKTMPAEWEHEIGDSAFDDFKETFEISTNAVYTNRLFLVTERLKKGLPKDAPKFVYYVADDELVNAFALPGGRVIVMRGLLEDATPEELAGVLAHEVSHVTEKHGMKALAQVIGPSLIAKYVFDGRGALAALTAGAAQFGHLSYSRDFERQADDEGFDVLMRANIDPRGLSKFFQKLRQMEGKNEGSDVFSTHPLTSERIKHLEERWASSAKKSGFQPVEGGPDLPKVERKPKLRFLLPRRR